MGNLLKIVFKDNDDWGKLGFLEDKYSYLIKNCDKNREMLDDFIDETKFNKNIIKIADFIFDHIGFYRTDGGYTFRGDTTMFDLSEYMTKDAFRKNLSDYKVFGHYNGFYDTFHGNFSQLKFAVENFEKLNIGKNGKGKNKTRDLMRDIVSYYRDILLARKWVEKKYIAKREWKKLKKQTFGFEFSAKGTNWTSDWYDGVEKSGFVIITARDEEHARKTLISFDHSCCIKSMVGCHRLDSCNLKKKDITKDFVKKWSDQQKKYFYNYRPYLIFLIK